MAAQAVSSVKKKLAACVSGCSDRGDPAFRAMSIMHGVDQCPLPTFADIIGHVTAFSQLISWEGRVSAITSGVSQQYADSSKLAARARLHREFSVGEPWFSWVMDRLPFAAGESVLDIGCGPAWFWAGSEGHFPKGLHLTLADQSEGMVTEATERCAPLGFATVTGQQADVTALPFADASFDVVIAMHMPLSRRRSGEGGGRTPSRVEARRHAGGEQ